MNGGVDVRTATMARILAQQGYHRKAAEIYRHLLQQDPTRTDLRQALESLERLAPGATRPAPAALLAEWIGLLLQCRRLRDVERIRARLHQTRAGVEYD